ncbi:hypothetical protein [Pseudomonas nitroreducens]|uniref:hypothetical protein n=1 Tax=Pseudomonas nitroreducens TaxID=46680 RepID=UPI002D7F4C32|nr:hypothetical protein [Pseudomonas nitroreducens]
MSRSHWFWHWLLGIAAIANFAFYQTALEQRDEARRQAKPVIEVSGTTMTVTCPKPITPTAASPFPRHERFIL